MEEETIWKRADHDLKPNGYRANNANGIGILHFDFEHIPFVPQMAFTVQNVPDYTSTKGYAIRKTVQYFICTDGHVEVTLKYGNGLPTELIDLRPGNGLLVDSGVWSTGNFRMNAVLLVLCDTAYDREGYITDWDEFVKIKTK